MTADPGRRARRTPDGRWPEERNGKNKWLLRRSSRICSFGRRRTGSPQRPNGRELKHRFLGPLLALDADQFDAFGARSSFSLQMSRSPCSAVPFRSAGGLQVR